MNKKLPIISPNKRKSTRLSRESSINRKKSLKRLSYESPNNQKKSLKSPTRLSRESSINRKKSPTRLSRESSINRKKSLKSPTRLSRESSINRKKSPTRLSYESSINRKKSSPKKTNKSKRKRVSTYCGNNKNSSQLRENGGDKTLGTNYQCMRIGFGAGYHNPIVDIDEFLNYEPIYIKPKMWCGNGDPKEGYVRGYPSDCLKKGFGAGQRKQALEMN